MSPKSLKALVVAIVGVVSFVLFGGCAPLYSLKYGPYYKLQELIPYAHNDDVVILARGYYKRTGTLYFIEKKDDKRVITQKLDLAPYLQKRSPVELDFNDRYLMISTIGETMLARNYKGKCDSRTHLLVFKKNDDGQWAFLHRFIPPLNAANISRVFLTERDQIVVSDTSYLKDGFHGIVRVYEIDSQKRSLTLTQEITSKEPRDVRFEDEDYNVEGGFGGYIFYADDTFVVRHSLSKFGTDTFEQSIDWSVYKWDGSRWTRRASLLSLVPQALYDAPRTENEKKRIPLRYGNRRASAFFLRSRPVVRPISDNLYGRSPAPTKTSIVRCWTILPKIIIPLRLC